MTPEIKDAMDIVNEDTDVKVAILGELNEHLMAREGRMQIGSVISELFRVDY